MESSLRIAITGVSGYLGRLLLERFDADPAIRTIVGFDLVEPAGSSPKLEFHRMDVRDGDFGVHLTQVDALIHLAFIVAPTRRLSAQQIRAINVDGSRRLFEAALECGIPRIVFASSIAVYGSHADNPPRIREGDPLRPNENWSYSAHKGAVESQLDDIERRSPEMIVIRLRPGILLGPSVDNLISRELSRGVMVSSFGYSRDYVWDGDVVDAFRLALDHPRSGAFNLSAEGALTIERSAELLGKRVLKLSPRLALALARTCGFLRLAPPDAIEWILATSRGPLALDSSHARNELGWQPTRDAEQTLVEFADRDLSRRQSPD